MGVALKAPSGLLSCTVTGFQALGHGHACCRLGAAGHLSIGNLGGATTQVSQRLTVLGVLQAIVAAATGQDQDARQAKELQPTTATRNATLSETNLLTQVDSASQEVIRLVSEAQSADTSSSPAAVEIDGQSHTLPSRMTIAELRKHKRAFMKLVTQNTFSRLENAEGAKLMFLEYLCSKL